MGELDRFKRCQEHLALWLQSTLTGCNFATSFSSHRPLKLDYYTPLSEVIDLDAIVSDTMGVGPLGTMPVTRRAPYFAIVAWGGPHLNEHITKTESVGVASAPTGLTKAEHRRLMKITDERVRELLKEPAEDPAWLRRVGFILPNDARVSLGDLLEPTT